MKKERIKSIILILLVLSNFVLGSKIWINKKLWPNGYNFFANVENSFIVKAFSDIFDSNESYISKTHITTPDKIIINTGYQTTRFSLDSTHDMFANANEVAYEILLDAFSSPSKVVTQVTKDEWYSVLTAKSIYLNYSIEYSSRLFSQFLGVKETEISSFTDHISDIVISADSTMSSNAVVYIKNNNTDTYYKIATSAAKDNLENVIDYFQQSFDDADTDTSIIINYSFDLLFDKTFGNQKVILAPMIPIFNNPQPSEIVKSDNPVLKLDNTFNDAMIHKLLNIFQINPNTVRRYTEASGTIVFVENDAILKLSPNGILEYTSKTPENGIKLISDTATPSAYHTIGLAADFMDRTNAAVSANKDLYISSDLTDEFVKNSSIEISFDYSANGLPVLLDIDAENIKHAVTMKVENGYLQNYVQAFRSYSNTDSMSETPLYIEALDKAIQQYSDSEEQVVVNKMYVGYRDDGSIGTKSADWEIAIGNNEVK